MTGNNGRSYLAPRGEAWVIEAIARSIGKRLQADGISSDGRRALLRALFGLQRFPQMTVGLNVNVEFPEEEISSVVRLTPEEMSVERGHTRLQYFPNSHHLIDLYDNLRGAEREMKLQKWLPLVTGDIEDVESRTCVEDYSIGEVVDSPPMNEHWDTLRPVVHGSDI